MSMQLKEKGVEKYREIDGSHILSKQVEIPNQSERETDRHTLLTRDRERHDTHQKCRHKKNKREIETARKRHQRDNTHII